MDPIEKIDKRVDDLSRECHSCREGMIKDFARINTAIEVLLTRYTSVERLVYAFCGTVLLAALGAVLRLIGWKP